MQLCRSRVPNAAAKRSRRGQKMRNGSRSSTTKVPAVATLRIGAGRCAAYHASGVGRGSVRK
jgi:hypothetical protein